MNHKRGRPKHVRMACFCKNWKDEREPKTDEARFSGGDRRRALGAAADLVAQQPAFFDNFPDSKRDEVFPDEGFAEFMVYEDGLDDW